MDREERRRILGDDVIAQIHARVAEAPDPSPELVEELRRIWTNPGGSVLRSKPGTRRGSGISQSRGSA
jgi:hypothetical protein